MLFMSGFFVVLAQSPIAGNDAIIKFDCDELTTSQTTATFGADRFKQDYSRRRQIYTIDRLNRTVSTEFGCGDNECKSWVEKANLYENVIVRPTGFVVYCNRTNDSPCDEMHTTGSSDGGTVTAGSGKVILHVGDETIFSWSTIIVIGRDRSAITVNSSIEGTCKRVSA